MTVLSCVAHAGDFSGLEPRQQQCLAGFGDIRNVAEGDMLARMGDAAGGFYLIVQGLLRLSLHGRGGIGHTVQTLHPGEVAGMSWLDAGSWLFDVVAVESGEVVVFDGENLNRAMNEDPVFGLAIARCFTSIMSRRLSATRLRLLDVWNDSI